MAEINLNASTYASVTWDNFDALAKCDMTGFPVLHKDLRRQMQYAGNSLVWTGFMVHKDFLDKPTPIFNIPYIGVDPEPVPNARPFNTPWTQPGGSVPQPSPLNPPCNDPYGCN